MAGGQGAAGDHVSGRGTRGTGTTGHRKQLILEQHAGEPGSDGESDEEVFGMGQVKGYRWGRMSRLGWFLAVCKLPVHLRAMVGTGSGVGRAGCVVPELNVWKPCSLYDWTGRVGLDP